MFPAFPAHAHLQVCVSGKRPMLVNRKTMTGKRIPLALRECNLSIMEGFSSQGSETWNFTCRDACRFPLKSVRGKHSRHSRCMRNSQFTYLVRGPLCHGLASGGVLISKKSYYSISQEICTRFLLCCALLWLYIDWFSHIHQAYFTGTVAI